MSGKKNRQKQQAKQVRQNTPPTPNKSLLRDNEVLKKVFSSLFYFAGSIVAVYELINYFRSDAKTFTSLIIPSLIGVVWLIVLVQMFRRENSYAYVLLAITVVGGVVGGIGWRSYNQTQEDKVIVLVAKFDGPEDEYHLRDEILRQLKTTTKDYTDTAIVPLEEVISEAQGSTYANQVGKKKHADLVIWGWYTKSENSNLNLYIENLSPNQLDILRESETYRPDVTISQLETLQIQKQIGSELSDLITLLDGYVSYEAGDYETALKRFDLTIFKKGRLLVVDDAYLLFLRANAYAMLGDYKLAIDDYSQVIQIKSDFATAFNNRGNSYSYLGENTLAINDYTKAIEIQPVYPEAFSNRGITYKDIGNYDLAFSDFEKAIQIKPDYAEAYNNRGNTYSKIRQFDQAINEFTKAIEIKPDFLDAYCNRGSVYAQIGDNKKALNDFNYIIRSIDSKDAITYYSRGLLYYTTGQYNHALEDFTTAIQLNPNLSEAFNNRGAVYSALKQYNLAMQDYEKAIQINPDNVEAYVNRGAVYAQKGQYDVAIIDFNEAIYLSPNYAIAYKNRGLAFQALGKIAEAEADFKKYEELTGEKP